jgi:hypothetical protein
MESRFSPWWEAGFPLHVPCDGFDADANVKEYGKVSFERKHAGAMRSTVPPIKVQFENSFHAIKTFPSLKQGPFHVIIYLSIAQCVCVKLKRKTNRRSQ